MSYPMTPPPTDYHQQLLAYLQIWRQLLEQSATLLPTLPVVPPMPSMPPGPPSAPPPPAAAVAPQPADYTQQLFGYLQAWRQYLEHSAGRPPGQPTMPSATPSPTPGPAQSSGQQSGQSSPPTVAVNTVVAPRNPMGSQEPADIAVADYALNQSDPGFGYGGKRRSAFGNRFQQPGPAGPEVTPVAPDRGRPLSIRPKVEDASIHVPLNDLRRGVEMTRESPVAMRPANPSGSQLDFPLRFRPGPVDDRAGGQAPAPGQSVRPTLFPGLVKRAAMRIETDRLQD